MAYFISYKKYVTKTVTRDLSLGETNATELATIGGVTYVSIPDGAVLPSDQPAEIAGTITPVTLTPELAQKLIDANLYLQHLDAAGPSEAAWAATEKARLGII